MADSQPPKCKNLVLDAGPLLSLSPLRGLAETYFTVPQVLSELKDHRAREHFEKLGLMSGVKVQVRSPAPASLTNVIQWSKKTGDYSVLSHADICVLALTHTLHEEAKQRKVAGESGEEIASTSETNGISASDSASQQTDTEGDATKLAEALEQVSIAAEVESVEDTTETVEQNAEDIAAEDLEPLDVELTRVAEDEATEQGTASPLGAQPDHTTSRRSPSPVYEDPSDEDDGEGEWITPQNVGLHKSRALDLLPESNVDSKGRKKKVEPIDAGCMTADFAMQNVLLQMGLNLVGLEGKRIEKVKNWVLRCHACFKICKDNSKKFCPSCGNNTLLRASVTLSSPTAASDSPVMQVHLKPNFQYRIRGTKYSIPAPKHGSAKTGTGMGLVLREDQVEYMRAKHLVDGKREREEARMTRGIISKGISANGANAGVSSWMDPDWIPEIASVGADGKGRTTRNSKMDGDMPQIGYGRKNPNERRKKK
ncbi:hypothetical protein FA15DRAFT_695776 [Coprinopsis marcescibilis]|uniref:20S-pre-rRNA D-site endonuclease NOB1 n=1 Tax=Coprinopsis marcescibilis TaxID=230819 RepID=A0A5C3KQD2_COPMA|nr:hypothetical protein FA15DRAFT_695776 [Coprinopsis marcescibilis]